MRASSGQGPWKRLSTRVEVGGDHSLPNYYGSYSGTLEQSILGIFPAWETAMFLGCRAGLL